MFSTKRTLLTSTIVVLLILSACASNQARLEARESLLLKSGFTIKSADTTQRQAILSRLPANQFFERNKDGRVLFVYADPGRCSCIYIGDAAAYDQYQSALIEYQSGRDDPGVEGARHESIDNYKADGHAAIDAGIEDFGPL
jgi:hypothetical protein